ncbi:phosphosulfolactate phosphohydrolase [Meiothermus sp. QL-1]|uniref:2-phosphosulfolactate phosphatase n=1 Tax=Meiothermus sp. QL-1 TaxID=2058095 RepID=UPI000E0BC67B|nr:2-phosphosulfolactate phosphatase [Meiothermus sp. QL-1]RDI95691.1 phosphosulfolactate phosphohydrolase [Meiothermus sp. QL-1]
MTIRVDLVPKPPYPRPVLLVEVFCGSAAGLLLARGAREVWVAKSVRAARVLAGQEGLLLGEEEALPPEGFHHGLSLSALGRLEVAGRSCVLLAPSLAAVLEHAPLGSALAYFRNARSAVRYALEERLDTVVAVPQVGLEPSLAHTVAAGFIARRLQQSLGSETRLHEGARMAASLLKAFPDPQEALVQSELGQALLRVGRSEELALASLISVEEGVPRLVEVRHLRAAEHGLSKDRYGFCFRG